MKISKIRICNLASIEGEYTIDFEQEPLRSAGIFAISGPTGSGKSTILDAMCLALYDKMPRFEHSAGSAKINDNGKSEILQTDVRNILRRGSAEGYSEVEFIGADGLCYRSSWVIRRSYGKADGNLQAQTLRVYNLSTGQELQGTKTDILTQLVRLIGLTYTQFTRTVLLAQNDFATFLKSDEKDKAELLEKLTGTEVYTQISSKVYERYNAEKQSLKDLDLLLKGIDLIPEDQVEPLRKELNETTKSITKQRSALEAAKKKQEALVEIKTLSDQQTQQNQEAKTIQSQTQAILKEIEVQKLSLENFEVQVRAKEEEIQEASKQDAIIKAKIESKGLIETKVKKIDTDLLDITKRLTLKSKVIDESTSKLKTIYQALNQSDDQAVEVVRTLLEDKNKANSTSLNDLNEKKNKLDIEQTYKQQQELSERKDKLNKLKSDFSIYLEKTNQLEKQTKRLTECGKETSTLNEQLEKLKQFLVEKTAAFEQAKSAYHKAQLQVSENVEKLRNQLKDGEACPVCGSKEHLFTSQAVASLFKVFEEAYNSTLSEVNGLNKQLSSTETTISQLIKETQTLHTEIAEQEKVVQRISGLYDKTDFSEAFINNSEKTLRSQEVKIKGTLESYNQVQKEIDVLLSHQTKIQAYLNQLSEVSAQIKAAEADYKLVDQERMVAVKTKEELNIELETSIQELKVLELERQKLLKGMSVEDVRKFIVSEKKKRQDGFDLLQKNQLELSQKEGTLLGRIEQLKVQLDKLTKTVENVDSEENIKTIELITNQLNELEKRKSELEYKLKMNDDNLLKFKKYNEQITKQTLIYENWAKLNDLIGSARGDRFKVIAQSYTLKILLLHANQHLSYLARRYKLKQIDESLSLQIIDCDMLNQERTILSLSGGESFLISLALALGLSSLSSNNLKVESLFIDEGFGSLDMDSLRTAMDALEQLQMQGRKIGVISHVQEMSERIPVQIRLIKEDQGRSKIEVG